MTAAALPLTDELCRVLWACLAYWDAGDSPPEERVVCFSWVEPKFRKRFGETFHQSKMAALAALGLLVPDDVARGGGRRYYRLADPAAARELMAGLEA